MTTATKRKPAAKKAAPKKKPSAAQRRATGAKKAAAPKPSGPIRATWQDRASIDHLVVALRNSVLFASPDAIRQVINAVVIEPHDRGLRFIATDSYGLFTEHIDAEVTGEGSALISRSDCQTMISMLKKPAGRNAPIEAVLDIDQDRGKFSFSVPETGLTLTGSLVEGKYPDWQALFDGHQDAGKVAPYGMGGWQYARLGKIARVPSGGDKNVTVVVTTPEPLKPALFTVYGSTIRGLIMPVRIA